MAMVLLLLMRLLLSLKIARPLLELEWMKTTTTMARVLSLVQTTGAEWVLLLLNLEKLKTMTVVLLKLLPKRNHKVALEVALAHLA